MGFTDVTSFKQYYENLEAQFAEKTMFKYYQGKNNIVEMTYGEFTAIVRSMIAGYEAVGLTGKRIAIVGETHPKWVASFIATVSSGVVASVGSVGSVTTGSDASVGGSVASVSC